MAQDAGDELPPGPGELVLGAGLEELLGDLVGDAEAAGGVLAVHHQEIGLQGRPQFGNMLQRGLAATASYHVTKEQESHITINLIG